MACAWFSPGEAKKGAGRADAQTESDAGRDLYPCSARAAKRDRYGAPTGERWSAGRSVTEFLTR
jgi:hypothetical protein